jgi:hypothetical protein
MSIKLSPQATKGHLVVGALLILLALGSLLAGLFVDSKIPSFLIFFFDVWGDVEAGRYLEYWVGAKNDPISNLRNNGYKLAVLPINPGADLALIRGTGHLPFLEHPNEYQAALSG